MRSNVCNAVFNSASCKKEGKKKEGRMRADTKSGTNEL